MNKNELPITFDGVLLNDLITPQFASDPSLLPGTSDTTLSPARSIGEIFKYHKYTTRKISIPFVMNHPDESKRQALAAILAVNEPKQLILGRAADRYYMAVPDGNIAPEIGQFWTTGTLTFTCYDPLAHAVMPKDYTGSTGEAIAVPYAGTAPAYPFITAIVHGDNGFVGFVNDQGGALQWGDSEAVDKVSGVRSDKPVNISYTSQPTGVTVNAGVLVYPSLLNNAATPNKQAGTVNWAKSAQTAGPVFSNKGSKVWAGPSISGALTPNYNDVNSGDFTYAGRMTITATTASRFRAEYNLSSAGAAVCGMVARSSTGAANDMQVELWFGSKELEVINLDRKKFPNGLFEAKMQKQGDVITYSFSSVASVTTAKGVSASATVSKTYRFAGFTDQVVDKWTSWLAQYAEYPVAYMGWADTQFTWVNEQFTTDIPNLFSDGDEIAVDVKNRALYVNGVRSGLYTIGNQWPLFAISGDTSIQPVVSSWAKPMDVTISVEEAFL